MRILITGATGLVGSSLVARCRQEGIEVHYLSTRPDQLKSEAGYRGFLWNPAAGKIDPECFRGVQMIVNLAGSPISQPWTASRKKKIRSSRVDSLYCLQKALKSLDSHQVEYLVSASAIGLYPSSFTEFYNEAASAGTGFLSETVVQWEMALGAFRDLGIPCGMLRIGLVLAREGGALPALARPVRWGLGAPLGSGQQWQSWIHREDLVSVFRFAMEHRLEGPYNAVAPNPVTNRKLTCEVAQVLGKPFWLPRVPSWALKLLMGDRSRLLLDSQRVSSEKVQMEGFAFSFPNLRPALENLLL